MYHLTAMVLALASCAHSEVKESFENWSLWSACSVTCGTGEIQRQRYCGSSVYTYCQETEKRSCILRSCKTEDRNLKKHSDWTGWSQCSATCGTGKTRRNRRCKTLAAGMSWRDCFQRQYKSCYKLDCRREQLIQWEPWNTWGTCSVSCGGGRRTRSRKCRKSSERTTCLQLETDSNCNKEKCTRHIVEAGWGTWGNWAKCTKTCGRGLRIRTRICNSKRMRCYGRMTQLFSCIIEPSCPQESWDPWSSWDECSSTCGEGIQKRTRTCSGEISEAGHCPGVEAENRSCNRGECFRECWNTWSNWDGCSTTCGNGIQKRSRTCNSEKSGTGHCSGVVEETRSCTRSECVTDMSMWSSWQLWTSCSKSCGSGWRSKTRACLLRGGLSSSCGGKGIRYGRCFKNCSEPGTWGAWSLCSVTCESGTRRRTRKCYLGPICMNGSETLMDVCNTEKCYDYGKCGQAGDERDILVEQIRGRVVMGKDAATAAWPWQVMLVWSDENIIDSLSNLIGGASVINSKWILTASHILGTNRRNIFVILGMTEFPKKPGPIPDYIRVVRPGKVSKHHKNDPGDFEYDVALIEVGPRILFSDNGTVLGEENFTLSFSKYIRPVCLPCISEYDQKPGQRIVYGVLSKTTLLGTCKGERRLIRAGNKVVVTGFGDRKATELLEQEADLPEVLQQGLMTLINHTGCLRGKRVIRRISSWDNVKFNHRMICAGSHTTDRLVDACRGDSGGPLVHKVTTPGGDQFWIQVGIVSWGLGCAKKLANNYTLPGYFTNILAVRRWVAKNIAL